MKSPYIIARTVPANGIVDIADSLPAGFDVINGIEIIANDYTISGLTPAAIGECMLEFGKKAKYHDQIQRYDKVLDVTTGIYEARNLATMEELDYTKCEPIKLGCNKKVKGWLRSFHSTPLTFKIYLYP